MSNNIVAIEEKPQMIPAECSFLGGDSRIHEWFIRVINPDTATDTLLISSTFFADMAKQVGYIKKTEALQNIVDLRGAIADASITLSNSATQLSHLRSTVADIATIQTRLDELRQLLTNATRIADSKLKSATKLAESSTKP